MIKSTTEFIVYESPDGSETIYQRSQGEDFKQIVSEKQKLVMGYHEWHAIIKMSETNIAIRDCLEQLKVLYELSKENN
jgi:hypothetical protein